MEEFDLKGKEFIELDNLLKLKGLRATGGQCRIAIAEGLVKVDGKAELRKRCKIRAGQAVEFEGHRIVVR